MLRAVLLTTYMYSWFMDELEFHVGGRTIELICKNKNKSDSTTVVVLKAPSSV